MAGVHSAERRATKPWTRLISNYLPPWSDTRDLRKPGLSTANTDLRPLIREAIRVFANAC